MKDHLSLLSLLFVVGAVEKDDVQMRIQPQVRGGALKRHDRAALAS